jgi:predicted CXXCH cytochrome family protein
MRCRVRFVSRHRSGSTGHTEQLIDVKDGRIKIGRGTDNDLFLKDLRVNYRHADIIIRDYDLVIEAVGPSVLSIDGSPTQRSLMTAESVIELGPYRLQLVPNEPGANLTLEVELLTPPPAESIEKVISPERVSIGGGLTGKRPLSWLLFLLLITVGLVLPILAYQLSQPNTANRKQDTSSPEKGDGFLAGFDRISISGELSSSHKNLGGQCEVCHEQAFVPVRSAACAACHADTQHHFKVARFQFAGFTPTGCTECHSEHEGGDGVIPAQQSLCADCHDDLRRNADLALNAQPTDLLDVVDFGADHPQFRPSVIVDPASKPVRVALGRSDFPKERSNLRFPHSIHLAQRCEVPAGGRIKDLPKALRRGCNVVQMARQRLRKEAGLSCGDCHRPEPGGVNMLPVRMQDHCAECHRLEFARGRLLPHGKPAQIIAIINDYYLAETMRAEPAIEEQLTPLRQRPGGADAGTAPAAVAPPPQDPVATAKANAAKKLNDLFGRSLCGVCHEITRPSASTNGRWEVQAVKVAALWMPKAQFDHAAHSTVLCTDCHKARQSRTSKDVLMPKIGTCRGCHGGEHASTALPSTCIMCHVYHRDNLRPMLPRAARASNFSR